MAVREPHFAIQFASKYKSPLDNSLNAWTAFLRLEELVEDVKQLSKSFDVSMPSESRWAPWVGAEIVSFYAVGFVTCLEWHARSRLVDLLTFKPAAARSEDLRVVKDKVVIEMLAANVTIASIVGAATNISSLEEYMGIFARIFSALDVKLDGFGAIKQQIDGRPWVEEGEIENLKYLFDFRNNLVHEIGLHRVGHPNVRDSWTPEEAISFGDLVQRTMKAIEAAISATMPDDFPNKLGADWAPVAAWQRLEREIPQLEGRIEKIITTLNDAGEREIESFRQSAEIARAYLKLEGELIDTASMLHNRYIDMRQPLREELLRSRHSYLMKIIEIVGSVWEIEEGTEPQ